MSCFENDALYQRIATMLDSCCNRVDDILTQREKKVEESKLNDELAARFEQELKINSELSSRVSQVSRRVAAGSQSQAQSQAHPDMTPGDCLRLNKAREAYQVGKEVSGVRWDFTAPPAVIRGYIRNEARKVLEPFEFSVAPSEACEACGEACGEACRISDALWQRVADAALGKENRDPLPHTH